MIRQDTISTFVNHHFNCAEIVSKIYAKTLQVSLESNVGIPFTFLHTVLHSIATSVNVYLLTLPDNVLEIWKDGTWKAVSDLLVFILFRSMAMQCFALLYIRKRINLAGTLNGMTVSPKDLKRSNGQIAPAL